MTTGITDKYYPIRPRDINTEALEVGYLADFTVSSAVIAAIIAICTKRASWKPVSVADIEAELLSTNAAKLHQDDLRDVYGPFYVVKDGFVQLTHECICECFKKFPSRHLHVNQNRHGVLS